MLTQLLNDETGFIVSVELVLIATILVIGLIVGLSEIQNAAVSELNDVGDAIGEANQGYYYSGFTSFKDDNGSNIVKAQSFGADFVDQEDDCDNNQCDIACDLPVDETEKVN